jgi:hypothetical protein
MPPETAVFYEGKYATPDGYFFSVLSPLKYATRNSSILSIFLRESMPPRMAIFQCFVSTKVCHPKQEVFNKISSRHITDFNKVLTRRGPHP